MNLSTCQTLARGFLSSMKGLQQYYYIVFSILFQRRKIYAPKKLGKVRSTTYICTEIKNQTVKLTFHSEMYTPPHTTPTLSNLFYSITLPFALTGWISLQSSGLSWLWFINQNLLFWPLYTTFSSLGFVLF